MLSGQAHRNGVSFALNNYTAKARRKHSKINVTTKRNKLKEREPLRIPFVRGLFFFSDISGLNRFVGVVVTYFMMAFIIKAWLYAFVVMTILFLLFKISPTSKYHAAEHMLGNAYDNGIELNMMNIFVQSRVHPRCGSQYIFALFFVMIVLLAIQGILTGILGIAVPAQIPVFLYPLITLSLGTEVYLAKKKKWRFLTPVHSCCDFMQWLLLTGCPGERHVEVAIAAFEGLMTIVGVQNVDEMKGRQPSFDSYTDT